MKITKKNLIIGVIVVTIIWFISGLVIYNKFEAENRGQVGDMFGAINALFSGLALFGIIVSILIQQKELKQQNEEFKINRLTNILFKQIEYLNQIIDNSSYDVKDIVDTSKSKVSIDNFIMVMDDLSNIAFYKTKMEIINQNSKSIDEVIRKSHTVFDNFRKLLENSKIENIEILQMKKLLKNNINPFLFPLITYKTEFIKYYLNRNKELPILEKGFLNIQLNIIKSLSEYDKE